MVFAGPDGVKRTGTVRSIVAQGERFKFKLYPDDGSDPFWSPPLEFRDSSPVEAKEKSDQEPKSTVARVARFFDKQRRKLQGCGGCRKRREKLTKLLRRSG